MSEPARTDPPILPQRVDVRVGSTANALQPISSAERSLAAGPAQWLALLAVAASAIVADQLTKQVVGRTLEHRLHPAVREVAHPPGESAGPGSLGAARPVEHPLHVPRDDHPAADGAHRRSRSSGQGLRTQGRTPFVCCIITGALRPERGHDR